MQQKHKSKKDKRRPLAGRASWLSRRRSRALLLTAVLAVAGLVALQLSRAATDQTADGPAQPVTRSAKAVAAEQILVRYKSSVGAFAVRDRYAGLPVTEKKELRQLRIKVLKVPAAERDAVLEQLRQDPDVEFAEPDIVMSGAATTPNDPEYASQWNLKKVKADVAWDKTKGSASMKVAVIDSGINASHPDLAGKVLAGRDFVNTDDNPADDHGHGSAVSSVIAANTDNGTGMAGGCWNCKIVPIKVLGADNNGTGADIIEGMQYAADSGARIINMSIAGPGEYAPQQAAMDYIQSKGLLVVAAAGNLANDVRQRPATYDYSLAVAATMPDDTLTNYSSFGVHVDIAAPGEAKGADHNGSGYKSWNGTSFAAPLVASIAALLWSQYPDASQAQIREALTKTTDTCCDGKITGGRVNAAKAMDYLATLPPPDPADLNQDGKVNITDLSTFLSNWGKIGTGLMADINKNGKVDITDLSILLSNWT